MPGEISVTVRLFASLREAAGTGRLCRHFCTIIPPIEWPISTGGAGRVAIPRFRSFP